MENESETLLRVVTIAGPRRFIPAETDPIIRYAPKRGLPTERATAFIASNLRPRDTASTYLPFGGGDGDGVTVMTVTHAGGSRTVVVVLVVEVAYTVPCYRTVPPLARSLALFHTRADVICRTVYPGIRGKSRVWVRRTGSLFTSRARAASPG